VQRILVAGTSGAGKSTLARRLGQYLDLPYVELDALWHGPGWQPRPEFEADVAAFSAGPAWVTEAQYHSRLGTLLWERADTVVWLDYSRPVVMNRVLRRTWGRALTRRELWNGNRESMLRWMLDPEHPVRLNWTQHARKRRKFAGRVAAHPHLTVHHFHRPRETRRWLAALGRTGPQAVATVKTEGE
jgi:adenylate kinase family enzyme